MITMSIVRKCFQHPVDGLQVDRRIFADRGVREAAGFRAHDAVGLQRAEHRQQALIFFV